MIIHHGNTLNRLHPAAVLQGRYSFVGAAPVVEIIAKGSSVSILDHKKGTRRSLTMDDPMQVPIDYSSSWRPAPLEGLPHVFTGGWVGYTGYDTVRYVYPGAPQQ